VLSEDAIGNVPLVKLVSLPNAAAVVPITLLELLEIYKSEEQNKTLQNNPT
jgi:hypothetical protein